MIFKKISLDLNFDYYLDADYTAHEGSCISYQKEEQQDIHAQHKGFPSTYHEHNTKIHQLWYNNTDVDYEKLGNDLGMDVVTVSSIMQPPGNIITVHRDTFFKIKKKHPNDTRKKVRANIYLEDWKVGHIIQYRDDNKKWHNSSHWTQGEGFLWDSEVLHLGANVGLEPKYTLQVSGFLK